MIREYGTPAAFKTALEDRLRKRAKESGSTIVRERQLLVFDRLLARLFALYSDSLVLKGGLVIEFRLERARTTKDIDLYAKGNPAECLQRLQRAGRENLGDYLSYEILEDQKHPEIEAEGMIYQGYRFRATAYLAGKIFGDPFGIDIAFGEPVQGNIEQVSGSEILQFIGIEPGQYRVYPVETHIAEKLHAYTMPRPSPNSRVKDLPDLALLAQAKMLEAKSLKSAIDATFAHRATHPVPNTFPDPPDEWEDVYARIRENDSLPWENLDALVTVVREFLEPVLLTTEGTWNPETWIWE